MTLPHPAILDDPRCKPGAYISRGRDLYEVLDTRVAGSFPNMFFWVLLENCRTEYKHEFNAKQICENYDLVKDAPETPNHAPAEAA